MYGQYQTVQNNSTQLQCGWTWRTEAIEARKSRSTSHANVKKTESLTLCLSQLHPTVYKNTQKISVSWTLCNPDIFLGKAMFINQLAINFFPRWNIFMHPLECLSLTSYIMQSNTMPEIHDLTMIWMPVLSCHATKEQCKNTWQTDMITCIENNYFSWSTLIFEGCSLIKNSRNK